VRERVFTHIVKDSEGESIKRFQSKREAEWFIENKPYLHIELTGEKRKTVSEILEQFEECPF
jgi:hypothetical protein